MCTYLLFGSFETFSIFSCVMRLIPAFVGLQVLLARLQMLNPPSNAMNTVSTGLKDYKSTADGLMCAFLPNSQSATPDRTKGKGSVFKCFQRLFLVDFDCFRSF